MILKFWPSCDMKDYFSAGKKRECNKYKNFFIVQFRIYFIQTYQASRQVGVGALSPDIRVLGDGQNGRDVVRANITILFYLTRCIKFRKLTY